jgi:mannose-6-phosphate isomerase-like protein (cupin superfamily)
VNIDIPDGVQYVRCTPLFNEYLDTRRRHMEASLTVRRFDATQGPRKLAADGGPALDLGSFGVRFMAWAEETGGGFSLIEHPIPPRTLVAPLHRHSREDEYSFVLEGRMGALLGDDVIYADAGELAFKPRNQWHTFWNAGEEPCRILEIISPGGFERFFEEMGEAMQRPDFTPARLDDLGLRYGLELDPDSVPRLCAEHGLDHPMLHVG